MILEHDKKMLIGLQKQLQCVTKKKLLSIKVYNNRKTSYGIVICVTFPEMISIFFSADSFIKYLKSDTV